MFASFFSFTVIFHSTKVALLSSGLCFQQCHSNSGVCSGSTEFPRNVGDMGGRGREWRKGDTFFCPLQIICLFNNFAKVLLQNCHLSSQSLLAPQPFFEAIYICECILWITLFPQEKQHEHGDYPAAKTTNSYLFMPVSIPLVFLCLFNFLLVSVWKTHW